MLQSTDLQLFLAFANCYQSTSFISKCCYLLIYWWNMCYGSSWQMPEITTAVSITIGLVYTLQGAQTA